MSDGQKSSTRLESAGQLIGSAILLGFDDLGTIEGVTVEARELRDDKGGHVLGALVGVQEEQGATASAFVDEDELPELLEAFRRFIAIDKNPTEFKFFEMTYRTRGGLQIAVFNDRKAKLHYYVRVAHARQIVTPYTFNRVEKAITTAQKKINGISEEAAKSRGGDCGDGGPTVTRSHSSLG